MERHALQSGGVSSSHWDALNELWRDDGLSQRELSRRVGCSDPSMAVAVQGLERGGFVRRVHSKEDRRRINVYLTPRAKAYRQTIQPRIAAINEVATRGLSPEDMANLRRILSQIIKNLADELSEPAWTEQDLPP
jgi:DNA-binding MarR family transcriptional regulator